jgi:mutator protein MutT
LVATGERRLRKELGTGGRKAVDVRVSVSLALIDEDGRWLVAKRAAGRLFEGLWEFPGGKVQPGETAGQAAVREAFEETGMAVEPVADLGIIEPAHTSSGVSLHLVRCRLVTPGTGGLARPCEPAVAEIRWVSPDELRTLPMPPANAEVLRRLDLV